MDNELKTSTSFIPKKPISVPGKKRHGTAGLFFVLAVVVFILSVGAAVGAYFYRSFLETRIANLSSELEREQAQFEPSFIEDVKELDRRMDAAAELLDRHVAFSTFFSVLEEETLKSVQFDSFSYTLSGGDEGRIITVSMPGLARDFSSLALQSDAIGRNRYFDNVVFSGISLDEEGGVAFEFSADVDPSLVRYKDVVTGL